MKFDIKTDSRKIVAGDTFVALKGISSNGEEYIEQAIARGATKIVCQEGQYSVETINVSNPRKYLQDYIVDNYQKVIDEMTLIAFTGTNGISTSVHILYEALNKLNMPCASVGTIGFFTKYGKKKYLPNTSPDLCDLFEMIIEAYNEGHKYLALEASSQALEYQRLDGLVFDYVIFSNLTRDHLDFHKTFENYALAKQKLFNKLKNNGKAIINIDDEYKDYFLLEKNYNITFGFKKSDYQLTNFAMNLEGSNFKFKSDKQYIGTTKLLGEYNVLNIMPVIIILQDLKISIDKILKVIATIDAPNGRIERIKYKTNNIYIDYAHTPDGLEKVTETIKKVTKGNTYVVFCCRGNRDIGRRSGMMKSATNLAKLAIVTNDHIFEEDPMNIIKDMLEGITKTNYEIILDRKQAIYRGIDLLEENDSLLILGHGHEEVLINEKHEKIPFVEKDIIEEYIKTKCS